MSLLKTYTPQSTKDIVGQDEAVKKLVSYVKNYKKQRKKAALLFGPSGVGKTSAVYALAKENGLEIFEINASEFRSKDLLQSKLGAVIEQHSLFSKGKIILLDEIDGLSGSRDRGALPEMIRLIQKSMYPIIMTVINPYGNKLSKLRSKTELIEFTPVSVTDISQVLRGIAKDSGMKISDAIIQSLARKAGGDLRGALHDLEILATEKTVTKETLEHLGMREQEENILQALLKIFKTTDPKVANTSLDYVNEDLSSAFLWIDENLPKEYEKAQDLARAYRHLSQADIFNRRIRRWQHWRFLVYINSLLTAGVAVSKDKRYNKFVAYKPTGRILKMWWAKQKSMKKKAIAEKLASATHTSRKVALRHIHYFKGMFKNNKMATALVHTLDLDKEQEAWMKK